MVVKRFLLGLTNSVKIRYLVSPLPFFPRNPSFPSLPKIFTKVYEKKLVEVCFMSFPEQTYSPCTWSLTSTTDRCPDKHRRDHVKPGV